MKEFLATLGVLSILFTLRGIGVNGNDHPLFNDPDEQYRYESKMGIPHRRGAYEQWREFGFYDEGVVKGRYPELDALYSSVSKEFSKLEMSQKLHEIDLDFAQEEVERVKRRSPPTYNHHSEAALALSLKWWEEQVIEARKELQDFEDQQKDYMEDVWETYKVILSVRGNARHPHLGYDFLSMLDEDHVVGDDSSTSISLGSDSETLTQNPSDIVDEPPARQLQDTDATRKIKRVGFMALGGLGVAGLIGLIYVVVSKLKSVFKSGNKPEKDRTGIVRRSTLEPGRQEGAMRVKSRLHSRHW